MSKKVFIIVRGAGDLATGVIHRLHQAGFQVLALETDKPAAIRRQVSFCQAVYEGTSTVEGVEAVLLPDIFSERVDTSSQTEKNTSQNEKTSCQNVDISSQDAEISAMRKACQDLWAEGKIPVAIDPEGIWIRRLQPDIVVDAIIAKRNLGTCITMAPLTIAIGPGFTAGEDVHYVIESMRGHNLGRIIKEGTALPDTRTPGNIGGYTKERVIHSPAAGVIHTISQIGDFVEKGQKIAEVESTTGDIPCDVYATIPGFIRGMIRDGYQVPEHFKIADIDPRADQKVNCYTISDKARCIAGSVLELVCKYSLNM